METGKFYYIKNDYYKKFENYGIMKGKEDDEFGKHGRPCFYCFEVDSLYWMIPISSQIGKYQKIYNEKIKRYPNYDGIRFGYVNGKKEPFYYKIFALLQKNILTMNIKSIMVLFLLKLTQGFKKNLMLSPVK